MKLFFVRHGESDANLAGEFSNTGCKHPLTAQGVVQAQTIASTLAGLAVERIYASPLLRAVQTAQIVAERLRAPVVIAAALREWSVGIYEGTTEPGGWALHRQVQEDWFDRQQLESRMPGGESFLDIRNRFVPFVQGLIAGAEHAQGNYVLVAHGGLYMAMLPAVLENIDFAFARRCGFAYTGCVTAEVTPGGLVCLDWCGTAPGG